MLMITLFSSPENKVLFVLRLSYCDSAVSVVHGVSWVINYLACVCSRCHIFSPIIMKLGQNVCLVEISDKFEIGSCRVKKLGH